MKSFVAVLSLFLAMAFCGGCYTRPGQISDGEFTLKEGQAYELQYIAIRFARRGYIDALKNCGRRIEDLKPYRDYNPYSAKPVRELPVGTLLFIKKIIISRSGFVTVVAIIGDDRVDISELAGGGRFESVQFLKVFAPKTAIKL